MIKSSLLHGAVLALLTVLAVPATFAQDAWTEEGGNAGDTSFNADQTILSPDNLDQMAILWSRFALNYDIYLPAPVAADGQAFVSRYLYNPNGKGHTDVMSLDTGSGANVWKVGLKGYARSPALTSSLVIVTRDFNDNDLGCDVQAYDRVTGDLAWHTDLPGVLLVEAPHVSNGVAYVATGNGVVALDATTGTELWSADVQGAGAFAAPVADGVVVSSRPGGMAALDATDGHLLWQETSAYPARPPLIVNGVVLAQDSKGMVHAFDLATGAVRWVSDVTRADSRSVLSKMATDEQHVFALLGTFKVSVTALDLATGATSWSQASLGEVLSPIVSNGVLYVVRKHNIEALDTATGHRLRIANLPGNEYGDISLAEGRLYLVGYGRLFGLGLPDARNRTTEVTAR